MGYTGPMNLLAIDTAVSVLSIALGTEQGDWYFEADAGLRHSELVMDGVDLLTRKAGLGPADLSGVACMGGPGSFTGLRIGFSLAKGLALSLGIPFVPVPTLDCMALPFAAWPGLVIPAIDAKKNAFFCALFRDGSRLGPPMDAEPAEIVRAARAALGPDQPPGCPPLLTGPGAEQLYQRLVQECPEEPRWSLSGFRGGYGRALLELFRKNIAKSTKKFNNNERDWFSGPEYIRKSDAELRLR